MTHAEQVKSIRKAQGLTQEHFATKYGLTRNFITRVEAGTRRVGQPILIQMLYDTPSARRYTVKNEVEGPVVKLPVGNAPIGRSGYAA